MDQAACRELRALKIPGFWDVYKLFFFFDLFRGKKCLTWGYLPGPRKIPGCVFPVFRAKIVFFRKGPKFYFVFRARFARQIS